MASYRRSRRKMASFYGSRIRSFAISPASTTRPACSSRRIQQRALASQWMDWQLSIAGPAIFQAFWGLIRTPAEKRDMEAIKTSQDKTTAAMKILDAQLGKTQYVAGPSFSYGDIPVGIMCYRFVELVPQRPPMPNLDRWYGAISSRQAFKDHVGSVPLS